MTSRAPLRFATRLIAAAAAFLAVTAIPAASQPADVYATYGVHSDAHADVCATPTCVYARKPGEPTDPLYPLYWTSHWAMYRVFNKYQAYPPPYSGKPPPELKDGLDYQTSWGATYYDSTWTGPSGHGAMEERYEKYCLPIFPIPNNYSCAFVSLGDVAFFVTYDDRPSWMPPVCRFSPRNHPPERDFIKHLPYDRGDSQRPDPPAQGYSFWIGADGRPMQIGAAPDRTADGGILFGYAFDAQPTLDRVDRSVPPYRHPQSFYFSGVPPLPQVPLPNAPIVSQNYTDFAILQPDPKTTWDQVAGLNPAKLPECQLFNPPPQFTKGQTNGSGVPHVHTWATISR